MGLTLLGGIFVPKYERWFRPNRIWLRRDFFLSNEGNDANPGTREAPWRTLNAVNSQQIKPGSTVRFEPGYYCREELVLASGSPGKCIQYRSIPAEHFPWDKALKPVLSIHGS